MAYTISSALAMLTRSGASREEIRAAEAIQEVLDIHRRGTLDISDWSNSPYTVLFDFCNHAMSRAGYYGCADRLRRSQDCCRAQSIGPNNTPSHEGVFFTKSKRSLNCPPVGP